METEEILLACATDDGVNYSKEHFGSAKKYLLFKLNLKTKEIKSFGDIENSSVEEKMHGDPEKAKSLSSLLNGVSLLIGFRMGPNIVRMRKKFIPVISREENIKLSLNLLLAFIDKIKVNLNKDGNKDIIYLNK